MKSFERVEQFTEKKMKKRNNNQKKKKKRMNERTNEQTHQMLCKFTMVAKIGKSMVSTKWVVSILKAFRLDTVSDKAHENCKRN